MSTGNEGRLERLSTFLHRLSRLAVVFVPAAVYYQVRAFWAAYGSAETDRPAFLSHFLVSLSLWGFFMALQSLADTRRMSPAEITQSRRAQTLLRRLSWVVAVAALGAIVFGLTLLIFAGDQLQGVAIICFGVGLLGVARFQVDRLSRVSADCPGSPTEST